MREEQGHLLHDLNTAQSTYAAGRVDCQNHRAASSSSSSASINSLLQHQERLLHLYQRAFLAATDEFKHVNDSLEKMRHFLRRRERKAKSARAATTAANATSPAVHAASATVATPPVAAIPAEHHHAAPSTGGEEGEVTVVTGGLSKHDKLNIWNHEGRVLQPGLEVAALVDDHSIPPLWILAVVQNYRPGTRPKYEVLDIAPGDDGEGEGESESLPARQKRYVLDARKILPLPSLEEVPINKRKEFAKGEYVRAVFPTGGITTLYPAVVVAGPRKRKNGTYMLRFEDDEDNVRSVSAQYVAPLIELPPSD